MFTGIVDSLGTVREVRRTGADVTFRIECGYAGYELGESIAVSGCCLSVVRFDGSGFEADASVETLEKTTLGELRPGDHVHLERALRASDRLGGHVVSGHVDGTGRLVSRTPLGRAVRFDFEVDPHLAPFLAPKGSVAIDGTSLTVNGAAGNRFDVVLVPISQDKTLFPRKSDGARVNIEVDVLAKYVARLLGKPGIDGVDPGATTGDGVSEELLRRMGYLDRAKP